MQQRNTRRHLGWYTDYMPPQWTMYPSFPYPPIAIYCPPPPADDYSNNYHYKEAHNKLRYPWEVVLPISAVIFVLWALVKVFQKIRKKSNGAAFVPQPEPPPGRWHDQQEPRTQAVQEFPSYNLSTQDDPLSNGQGLGQAIERSQEVTLALRALPVITVTEEQMMRALGLTWEVNQPGLASKERIIQLQVFNSDRQPSAPIQLDNSDATSAPKDDQYISLEVGICPELQAHLDPEAKHAWLRDEACPVCLQPWEVGDKVIFLPCLHRLHYDCAAAWANSKPLGQEVCPKCNSPMFPS